MVSISEPRLFFIIRQSVKLFKNVLLQCFVQAIFFRVYYNLLKTLYTLTKFNFFQDVLYLMALFGMKKGKKADEIINLAQQTVESHFQQMAVIFNFRYNLFYVISENKMYCFFYNT